MSAQIKTWKERLDDPLNKRGPMQCIEDENRELRAALAATTAIRTDIVRVCPDRDVECGNFPHAWCSTCQKRSGYTAPVPHQAAGDSYAAAEIASWQPTSLRYMAFCAGCPYCLHWNCTLSLDKPALDWSDASPPSEGEPQS